MALKASKARDARPAETDGVAHWLHGENNQYHAELEMTKLTSRGTRRATNLTNRPSSGTADLSRSTFRTRNNDVSGRFVFGLLEPGK